MAVPSDSALDHPALTLPEHLRRWDVFCRVIDNHGDLGVCLRVGRDLAARGAEVRLWCDDLRALAWMQPAPVPGLTAHPWPADGAPTTGTGPEAAKPADVVIEAFGCDLPETYLARMAQRAVPPAWINLEYLSAEDYVERSHGLQSPQFSGAGRGLNKWFFYPGFTARTGGLPREPGLVAALDASAGRRWLADRGWAPMNGERVLSAFTYPHAPWDALLDRLTGPWLLLLCPGAAQQQIPPRLRAGQRCIALPYLSQSDYDQLLASCNLNLVRGEDSFVRAQWAARPLLWHIYAQDDGAHGPKLQAFLDLAWADASPPLRAAWQALHQAWNGLTVASSVPPDTLSDLDAATTHAQDWRAKLLEQPDLVTQLMGFALGKAGVCG